MNLIQRTTTLYNVNLMGKKEAAHPGGCPPGEHMVGGRCIKIETFTLGEPFGPFKDFDDCLAKLGSREECGALQRDLEQSVRSKLIETLKKNKLLESVDFTTWVIPTPEDNLIEGEVIHVTVSGNKVDYTKEELLPAVNTLIGKPVWWVPLDEATMPEALHSDPKKAQVGQVVLARFDNNTIHALMEVTPEVKQLVNDGTIIQGSIEADFVVDAQSDKAIADRKPEFIQFTGYLLLPKEGTQTPAGPIGPPGDSETDTRIFEQMKKQLGCSCPGGMTNTKVEKSIFY